MVKPGAPAFWAASDVPASRDQRGRSGVDWKGGDHAARANGGHCGAGVSPAGDHPISATLRTAPATRTSAPAFWAALGVPASPEQRGRRKSREGLRPRCSGERRPPSEPVDPDLVALPVECPVPICAGRAAVPGGLSCTNTDPAHPGGARRPSVEMRPRLRLRPRIRSPSRRRDRRRSDHPSPRLLLDFRDVSSRKSSKRKGPPKGPPVG